MVPDLFPSRREWPTPSCPWFNTKQTLRDGSPRSLTRQEPVYLPANSELDVQIWRLTDNTKRRVWFEWAAQTYLVASASPGGYGHHIAGNGAHYDPRRGSMTGGTASPPGSVTSGTFSNHRFSAGSSAALMSPSLDAFQSAPSPHLGASGSSSSAATAAAAAVGGGSPLVGGGEHRMSAIVEEGVAGVGHEGASPMRIKISQTRLHNPGGKTSWIGL